MNHNLKPYTVQHLSDHIAGNTQMMQHWQAISESGEELSLF